MESVSNKKTIKQLIKGDIHAFDKIFNEYNQKVYNFCKQLLTSEQDAREVTQEVFIALWQNRTKINPESSLSAYIFGIARNQIYNIYRKSVHIQAYLDYLQNNDRQFDFATDDQVMFRELDNFVTQAIEELPPRRKEIFKLSRFEGLTYKEIAIRLNISENTVDVQIRKSLGYLRKVLKVQYKVL